MSKSAAAPAANFPPVEKPPAPPALLLVIAGPAGTGKTTLCDRIVRESPGMERVITATTRKPRDGEVNGRDYYFLSDEEFDRLLAENAFLEWARVHDQSRRYGTLRRVIAEKLTHNTDLCINIDVQGVANIRRAAAGDPLLRQRLVTVFVMPTDFDEIRARMLERGKDSPSEIERRIETARVEMREWPNYDYCIRSGTKDADFAVLHSIFVAEKNRVSRLSR
jgi:guanylate kinase